MSRDPDQLAPSWLPRQQRRRIDRELHRLLCRDTCSVCGSPLEHNSRTTSGLDAQGAVVVAGECCASRIAVVLGHGIYSKRNYDFIQPSNTNTESTSKQIADAITTYQQAIAGIDKQLDDFERHGGGAHVPNIVTEDYPWKDDDREWFERNQSRAHRARMPFPGEIDEEKIKASAEHALVVLIRQIKPGARLRAAVDLSADFLPVPDDEATIHALFEAATEREAMPHDRDALRILAEKYATRGIS